MATESITVNVGGQPSITVEVAVEQAGGEELPAFAATLRGLSPGDDTPINAYATDLDGYATDIDEAQGLLDAAQVAGDLDAAARVLRAAPPSRATDFTAELDQPAALAYAAPAAPLAGMPARATDL